jgi:hypothetical protein
MNARSPKRCELGDPMPSVLLRRGAGVEIFWTGTGFSREKRATFSLDIPIFLFMSFRGPFRSEFTAR